VAKKKPESISYDMRLVRRYLDEAISAERLKTKVRRGTLTDDDRCRLARAISAAAERRMGRETRRWVEQYADKERIANSDLAGWSAQMRRHIAAANMAAGNALLPGKPTASDKARLDAKVRSQNGYLDGFVRAVRRGDTNVGPAMTARARLYGASVWCVGQQLRRDALEETGYDEEKNVLGKAEHCHDCIDQTEQGWQPIGTLKPIGDRSCKSRCACHFIYRRVRAGQVQATEADQDEEA
jgi:hypothetical protein